MRRGIVVAMAGWLAAACANGSSSGPGDDSAEGTESPPPSETLPGSGFDPPSASSGGGKSSSSGGGKSSSGGGSSSSSSSGGTSSSSSGMSSTSSSGGASSGSSGTSTSSGGATGGACGICDRNWTCNGFTDFWMTDGAVCTNQRTTTALRCDHKFDQGGSVGVGTWSGNASKITLTYPLLGGGTKSYDCLP